jgi:FkbM family methyltransferase
MQEIHFKDYTINYNDPHDIAAIIECYILDVYESRNIGKGDTVIDIGAGIGEFAVLASKLVGNNGKVIAIEPSPDDFNTLLMNLKINLCNNAIPLNLAISDKPEKIKIEFKGKTFESKADSIANILRTFNIDTTRIKFMKMDIEGGERLAIPSSLEIIEKLDFFAIEIHDGYSAELIPFMDNLGFDFERIKRRSYLGNVFKAALFHPGQVYKIYKRFKQSGEYPGFAKISSGIEISSSDDLVVGTFIRRQNTQIL